MYRRLVMLTASMIAALMLAVSFGAAAQNIKLEFWGVWGASSTQAQAIRAFNEEFTKRYPNIEVEYTYHPGGEYRTKLSLAATTGTMPDIFWVWGQDAAAIFNQGLAQPLDDLVRNDPDIWLEDFFPPALNLMTYQGTLYGLPYDFGPKLLGYNKDLLAEAGVAEPDETWRWEHEFKDAARRVARPEDNVYALGSPIKFIAFFESFGAEVFNEDRTRSNVNSPEAADALNYWLDAMYVYNFVSGMSDPSAPPPSANSFTEGRSVFTDSATWEINRKMQGVNWGLQHFPAGPAGKAAETGGSGHAISVDTDHLDAAYLYLKELTSSEGQVFLFPALGSTARISSMMEAMTNGMIEAEKVPAFEVALTALTTYDRLDPWYTGIASMSEVRTAWDRMMDSVFRQEITVPAALEELERQINVIMSEGR